MKMRAPAYPLISIDPYVNVWLMGDLLNADTPKHWTGTPMSMTGVAVIDGTPYCFMGRPETVEAAPMRQTGVDMQTFSTVFTFEAAGVCLQAAFTSPLLPDSLEMLSRPASYLEITVRSLDAQTHDVEVQIRTPSLFCIDHHGQCPVFCEEVRAADGVATVRMGGQEQAVLGKRGDAVRIDWGYFYLSANGESTVGWEMWQEMNTAYTKTSLCTDGASRVLVVFAYDDLYSLTYFYRNIQAYWKRDGRSIETVIAQAYREYDAILAACREFHEQLQRDAIAAGGEEYAELLTLACRQVLASHKLAVDTDGQLLYVSKECYSNGCAATVDVSYPSIPLFLLYNPELIKGMLRPIFRFAAMDRWPFDFAPHDVGTYPILNGQVYGNYQEREQMPVEECGNVLLIVAALTAVEKDAGFAGEHRAQLDEWAAYLLRHGADPENQLCTDDFAGHLAHNCNLSLKAVMALAGYARVCRMMGAEEAAARNEQAARDMADTWMKTAADQNGSYRLSFDRPGSYSLKYNGVWDKVMGLQLFPPDMWRREIANYWTHMNPYGVPLDDRADYTKSDWMLWTATLVDEKDEFERFIRPMWLMYHLTPCRVPMTDWYSTVTSGQCGFQNRTVQGGLWMKLLEQTGRCRFAD